MTVIAHDARNQYTATSGQTIFSYTFEIADETDIQVFQRAAAADPDDTADILVLTTDYTVTGVGDSNGGTIVLVTGATLNDIISIQGAAPAERDTSFTTGGVIQAANLNLEFDNDVLIYQTILATLDLLTPKYAKSAVVEDFDLVLPILPANNTWVKNGDDDEIIPYELPESGIAPANATYLTLTDFTSVLPSSVNLAAAGTGFMVNNAGVGILARTFAGTSNQIGLTNGTGTGGNVVVSIVDDPIIPGTAGMGIPTGTTAQRVIPASGIGLRYNIDLGQIEFYAGGMWNQLEDSSDIADLIARLAAYTAGNGASMIGLEDQGSVVSKTVQDLAEAGLIAKTDNGTLVNGQFLGALTTGILRSTTTTGVLSIDAPVTAFSNLSFAADKLPYATGAAAFALTDLTAFARTLLDDANAATAAATLAVLPLAGGTMTGAIVLAGDASAALNPVSLQQMQAAIQNVHPACLVSTTANLAGYVYANGASGVGATLTAGGFGAFSADGVSPAVNSRIFIPFQTAPAENGLYVLTVVGNGGTAAVLTRATDFDTASEMNAGDVVTVVSGTLYGGTRWMMTQTAAITVGTTAITWSNITNTGALLIANNLSELTATASTARGNISAAKSGANSDITSMTGLTGVLQAPSGIYSSAAEPLLIFGYQVSAVNYFQMENVPTGNGPQLNAVGTDASIPINFGSKNSSVNFYDSEAGIAGHIRIFNAAYTQSTGFKVAAAAATSVDFTLPSLDGAAGTSMITSGAGVLSFLTKANITEVKTVLVTSSSTYTPTSGTKYVIVEGVGGGGGGGGAATTAGGQWAHGGGGGYGGYFRKLFTAAEIGADAAVTIGAAGAASAVGNNAGGTGGDTIFNPAGTGATLTGAGGAGGGGCPIQATANMYDAGGLGGTATNGDLNVRGARGGFGMNLGANQGRGGDGANGIWGSGANGGTNVAGGLTFGGAGYGAGGGGGGLAPSQSEVAGSAGTIGLVAVTEFISI